jgi:hypothetical protein
MAFKTSSFNNPSTENPLSQGGLFQTSMEFYDHFKVTDGICHKDNGTVYIGARLSLTSEDSDGLNVTSDQYSKAVYINPGSNQYGGMLTRVQTSAGNADSYAIEATQSSSFELYHHDVTSSAVNQTALKSYSVTPSSGQTQELRTTGSNPVINTAVLHGTTQSTHSDSTYLITGGQPGFWVFSTGVPEIQFDDWEGGDILAASVPFIDVPTMDFFMPSDTAIPL